MLKRISLILMALCLSFSQIIIADDSFESLLFDQVNSEFNTVDGYHKFQRMNENARRLYLSSGRNANKYLLGNIRFGISIFDDLKNNFDAGYVISYILNSRPNLYADAEIKNLVQAVEVTDFFKENNYDILSLKDILVGAYRMSFTKGKNHDILEAGDKILLDEIIDRSIQEERYPLICGEMANIPGFNGRTGTALFPTMYCNYFLKSSQRGLLSEPEKFSGRVGYLVSPEDIDSYFYISLDDARRIIKGKEFLGVSLNNGKN